MHYQSVKLRFPIIPPTEYGCQAERMWVKIDENGKAFLDNHPVFLTYLKCGDEIDITNLDVIEFGDKFEQ